MQNPDLNGKTALVTGGGRGIGRAAALALAECGARVIVTARGETEIAEVARRIRDDGGDAVAISCDVADRVKVKDLFDRAGVVDVLVNNAGVIAPIAPLVLAEPTSWLYNVAVNLGGVFLPCRFALPGMLSRGWGRVINISSGAAKGGTTGWSAYSAAKAGVEAMTRTLAAELAGTNVHVNAVRPGIVDTKMQVEIRATGEEDFGASNVERFHRYKEQGLLRRPDDPARLILWLLTSEADGLTGEVLAIDDPEVADRIGLQPMGR